MREPRTPTRGPALAPRFSASKENTNDATTRMKDTDHDDPPTPPPAQPPPHHL
jgi:hypothetical protein